MRYLRSALFLNGFATPDVLPNFPVRCLKLYRVLTFNELKQKRRDFQWIVAVFDYIVLPTAAERIADFVTVLIHTWGGYNFKSYSVTGYPANSVFFFTPSRKMLEIR